MDSNENGTFSTRRWIPLVLRPSLQIQHGPIEGWGRVRGSGSFVETGKLVNRGRGAKSQNRRRAAKFSRLVETPRRDWQWGKCHVLPQTERLCPGPPPSPPPPPPSLVPATVPTRLLIGGSPISGSDLTGQLDMENYCKVTPHIYDIYIS